MVKLKEAVDEFLNQKRIAVAGVSRSPDQAANLVYRRLRDAGYDVFPVNPNATEAEGDACYPDVGSVPGGVDATVVVTTQDVAMAIAKDCAGAGVKRVWLHRGMGPGSVSEEAADYCRTHGIQVIAGGCPNMFLPGTDLGHTCMRWWQNLTGSLPKEV
jgi:hypothetical protein